MELNQLPKITTRAKKRLGRGYGSGKGGHTVGRGQKGQKARGKVGLLFEGTKMRKSLVKRLPFLRGKGKFKSLGKKPICLNLKYLNLLPKNAKVDIKTLAKYNLVKENEAKKYGVKILGDGELTKPLTIKLPTSHQAAEKIKKVGGEVVEGKSKRISIKNKNNKKKDERKDTSEVKKAK